MRRRLWLLLPVLVLSLLCLSGCGGAGQPRPTPEPTPAPILEFPDGTAASVDADTDVGNIKLLLAGAAADWAMELETDVGDVTVDGLDQGRRYQTAGGQYRLEADSDTGDVEVEFK